MTDPMVKTRIRDLMSASSAICNMKDIINLTDVMKQSLINGVMQVKNAVVFQFMDFYFTHEFELDTALVPMLRDVVQCYAEAGGKL